MITHPERLTWIGDHYEVFKRLALRGAWMQITAGSLTDRFGEGAKYWDEKMLDDGLVHILATDAHTTRRRAPRLAEGRQAAKKSSARKRRCGWCLNGRAQSLMTSTFGWPLIVAGGDVAAAKVAPIPALSGTKSHRSLWSRLVSSSK